MSDPREALQRILSEHRATLSPNCRTWTCSSCPEWESQGKDWTDREGQVRRYHDPDEIKAHQADVIAREFLVVARSDTPVPDDRAEWWTPPMRTPIGRWIKGMFEHPCDGMPYSEDGYDARGPIITVRNLLRSVRMAEREVKAR